MYVHVRTCLSFRNRFQVTLGLNFNKTDVALNVSQRRNIAGDCFSSFSSLVLAWYDHTAWHHSFTASNLGSNQCMKLMVATDGGCLSGSLNN